MSTRLSHPRQPGDRRPRLSDPVNLPDTVETRLWQLSLLHVQARARLLSEALCISRYFRFTSLIKEFGRRK